MKFAQIKTKNTFTATGITIYYGVLAVCLALLLSRGNSGFWQSLPLIGGYNIGSHISNFSLIVTYLTAVGSMNMLTNYSKNYIITNVTLLFALNLIIELFVSILNTPDIIDALYGIAGIILSVIILVAMKQFGIRPNKTSKSGKK